MPGVFILPCRRAALHQNPTMNRAAKCNKNATTVVFMPRGFRRRHTLSSHSPLPRQRYRVVGTINLPSHSRVNGHATAGLRLLRFLRVKNAVCAQRVYNFASRCLNALGHVPYALRAPTLRSARDTSSGYIMFVSLKRVSRSCSSSTPKRLAISGRCHTGSTAHCQRVI